MSWVTVVWGMLIGACAAMALPNLFVGIWQKRGADLFFVGVAAGTIGLAAGELAIMHATSAAQYGVLQRWLGPPIFLLVISMVGFVRLYFGTGLLWLGITTGAVRLVCLIINFVSPVNLTFTEMTALRHVRFFGETVAVGTGVVSPWVHLAELTSLLMVVYVTNASISLCRKGTPGDRRKAIIVGGSIVFFVLVAQLAVVLFRLKMTSSPYPVSLWFFAIVAAMAFDQGYRMLCVQRDLAERLRMERLAAAAGAAFVSVSPERLDEQIEVWMRRMIDSLGADRIGLFEFTTNSSLARNTHQATRKGVPRLAREFPHNQLSWYLGELRAGRPVVLADLTKELPAQATAEREFAREHGTRAVMGFPVAVSGAIVNAIDCVLLHKTRVWSEPAQNALRLIGEIFANALAQRRAEIALRESEERFRIVADSAPVPIWMSGTDKLCTFFNKPWLEFTGRTMEQEMGNGWAEGVHPDDLQRCLKIYTEAFDVRRPFVMQYRLRRQDGEYRLISDNGVPRYDAHKNFAGYIGSCMDITELMRKEEALRESEERMSLAAEAANLAVWEWDLSKDEVWTTGTHRELPGRPVSEKGTMESFISRLHIDDRDRVRQALKDAIDSGEDFASEFRFMLPDGRLRWATARGRCIKTPDGKNMRFRGVSMDVTAQKDVDDLFRLATESSLSGVILVNEEGHMILVNSQVEKLFGYQRDELVGKSVDILVPERFASQHPTLRAKFLAAPTTRAMGAGRELFAQRKDGSEFPVEIGLNPIQTPDGTVVLTTVVDITARKLAEAEALRHREEIGHLSRVAAMGELAASIAHELNQPLSGIVSNAAAGQRFIDRSDVDLKEIRELLADISADGRRAGDVIRGIQSMVKKRASARQPVNLNDLVMNVVQMVKPNAMLHSCEVGTFLDPHLPTVEADPVQLQQVLLNLIINAFDAMRDTPAARRKVAIATQRNGENTIRASVRDYGVGIPEEVGERVFEQFFTTKAKGLGMGLAIVRSIIESHGGTIAVENADGGGARFSFTLPLNSAAL
jgi:PAS domain S-box-containing protein